MSTLKDRYQYHHDQTQNATAAATLVLAEQVAILVGLLRNVDQTVTRIEEEHPPVVRDDAGEATVRAGHDEPFVVRIPLKFVTHTQTS